LSILEKYFEFKCFNIQTIVKTEEEKEKEKLLQKKNKNKNNIKNNKKEDFNDFNENEEIDLI
jgi:hypothetical protein